ncbi:MAG: hypothetical protein ACI934_000420 [Pseudohongiellaceae bacterium]|jgi:hypothetical protein
MLLVVKLPGFVWTGLKINSRKSQVSRGSGRPEERSDVRHDKSQKPKVKS